MQKSASIQTRTGLSKFANNEPNFRKKVRMHMEVNEMSKTKFVIKLFPLAIAFGVSVTLSNEAYRYCTVPFLQMCKELNIVFVYLASVVFALERLNARTCVILGIVIFGCTISIPGQVKWTSTGRDSPCRSPLRWVRSVRCCSKRSLCRT